MNIDEMKTPRTWKNAEMPGAYALATRVGETVINAGDNLSFEQYITGYGEISNCKIQCYISSDLFDRDSSSVHHTPYIETQENGSITIKWGRETGYVDNAGYNCICMGVKTANWKDPTLFFDANEPGLLITELKSGKAPFEYNLKTSKTIRPGSHYIDFYLTYFNGQEWKTSKERLDFRVNNTFEKNSTTLSLLAALALLVTIAHDGIAPAIETIHEIGKFVSQQHHSPK